METYVDSDSHVLEPNDIAAEYDLPFSDPDIEQPDLRIQHAGGESLRIKHVQPCARVFGARRHIIPFRP